MIHIDLESPKKVEQSIFIAEQFNIGFHFILDLLCGDTGVGLWS